jgi:hypothetical protein
VTDASNIGTGKPVVKKIISVQKERAVLLTTVGIPKIKSTSRQKEDLRLDEGRTPSRIIRVKINGRERDTNNPNDKCHKIMIIPMTSASVQNGTFKTTKTAYKQ